MRVSETSGVGLAFRIIGLIVWAIAAMVGVFGILAGMIDGEGAGIGFIALFGGGFLGLMFYSIGEILCSLKGIYAATKNSSMEIINNLDAINKNIINLQSSNTQNNSESN